jgi:hypothetical protein
MQNPSWAACCLLLDTLVLLVEACSVAKAVHMGGNMQAL